MELRHTQGEVTYVPASEFLLFSHLLSKSHSVLPHKWLCMPNPSFLRKQAVDSMTPIVVTTFACVWLGHFMLLFLVSFSDLSLPS